MLRSIGSYLVLLSVVAGCGVDSKKSNPTQYTDFIPQTSQGELRDLDQPLDVVQQRITLDEKAPQGLGLLLAKRPKGVSTCTVFLLSETLAMTNARCLPELKNKECADAVSVVIKTQKGQETRRCKQITASARVRSSSLSDPDYAVFELAEPILGLRLSLPSREGILDGEDLSIESLNPVLGIDGRILGEFKKNSCRAYSDSLIGNFSDRRSSVIPLFPKEELPSHCAFVAGSSGSPIKNQLGLVVGVLFATRADELFVAADDLPAAEGILDFAVVSNLSCLKVGDAKLDQSMELACPQIRREELRHKERMLSKISEAGRLGVMAELNRIIEKLPSSFSYELTESEGAIELKPTCVKPLASWSNGDRERIQTSGLMGRRKSYEAVISRYRLSQKMSLDRYARLVVTPAAERLGETSYLIPELQELLSAGAGRMESRAVSSGAPELQVLEIKLCDE